MSEVSFNQLAHSTLKNYFTNKEVPQTNSLRKAPYYQKKLAAKMDKGIMEVDLSLNRRSPIKIDLTEITSLPLQILFLNKGKGKIKELTELCLITSLPLWVKNTNSWTASWNSELEALVFCLIYTELENLNFMLKEQEKQGQIPRYVEELIIVPGEDSEEELAFHYTNNPFDLNIDAVVFYTYSLEEDTNFKITS